MKRGKRAGKGDSAVLMPPPATRSKTRCTILIPDVLTQTFSFLGLEDRLSVRLTSREFKSLCPSPWRLLGDVLEIANVFDVCTMCEAKLCLGSEELKPNDGFNRARRKVAKCDCSLTHSEDWPWKGTEEEAAIDAADETKTAFIRSDPRRHPEFVKLSKIVRRRSYVTLDDWINSGPFASKSSRTPEAERLRRLIDFSRRCVARLHHFHDFSIRKKLSMAEGSWSWNYDKGCLPSDKCAYQIMNELASLNVAADELFLTSKEIADLKRTGRGCTIYHYRNDCPRQWANEYNQGLIEISPSSGSSLWRDIFFYRQGMIEDEVETSLIGKAVGSAEHISYLLKRKENLDCTVNAFGETFTELYFDALAPIRKNWPFIRRIMQQIDSVDSDSEDERKDDDDKKSGDDNDDDEDDDDDVDDDLVDLEIPPAWDEYGDPTEEVLANEDMWTIDGRY